MSTTLKLTVISLFLLISIFLSGCDAHFYETVNEELQEETFDSYAIEFPYLLDSLIITFNSAKSDNLLAVTYLNRTKFAARSNEKFKKFFLNDVRASLSKDRNIENVSLRNWYSSVDQATVKLHYLSNSSAQDQNISLITAKNILESKWYVSKVNLDWRSELEVGG